MSKCTKCGGEGIPRRALLGDGQVYDTKDVCDPCWKKFLTGHEEKKKIFEALLATGMSRSAANAAMIRLIRKERNLMRSATQSLHALFVRVPRLAEFFDKMSDTALGAVITWVGEVQADAQGHAVDGEPVGLGFVVRAPGPGTFAKTAIPMPTSVEAMMPQGHWADALANAHFFADQRDADTWVKLWRTAPARVDVEVCEVHAVMREVWEVIPVGRQT